MTDVRQTTATIVLGEDLEGRVFIRNAAKELVAEISKPAGRRVEIGVEPGPYEIRLERAKASMTATARVQDGSSVTMEPKQFGPAALETTRSRGAATVAEPFAVAGRHRIELLFGGSTASATVPQGISVVESVNGFGGFQYTVFAREDLGITIGLVGRAAESATVSANNGVLAADSALLALPVGVRWNPFTSRHPSSQLKPFVAATIGPVFGAGSQSFVGPGSVANASFTETTVGGDALLGMDFHIARWFSVSVTGGYNWMANFSRPIGAHSNYGGPEFGFSFGFLFGKGR
jgi:hypothetical protein